MYLSNIVISNFRLFESLELKLNEGINVLVGANDSGKTALVDAICYVLGVNSNDRSYVSEQDFFLDTDEFLIRLKFSNVDKHAYRFVEHLSHEEYTDSEGNIKRRPVLYVQLRAQKTGIERRGYPFFRTEIKSGIEGNGLTLESEIRDFLAATYLKPLRDAEAELSNGRASRLSQILSSSKEIQNEIDTILGIVASANKSLLDDEASLKKSAEKIQNEYFHNLIFEAEKENLGVFIDMAGIKEAELVDLPESRKKGLLRQILEGLNLSLTEDNKLHGLGYHNLLYMAAELLLLEQEKDKDFPLLLVEEPEAHLQPQLQMKLLQFIESKVKSSESSEKVQCIITTHSPNISSKVDPSKVIMLNAGKAWSLRPEETELKAGDYNYLRKFLDATKANVFFAKSLIFVEGDAENILLPRLASLLGRPLENYGVSIVKYDNSGSWKRFARLFLKPGIDEAKQLWFPTKVCVMRDLDLWPDCAEIKDENPYGFKKSYDGNQKYWRRNCDDELKRREYLTEGLSRQNVKVEISDDWTFEYCLAKYGLFDECDTALQNPSEDETNFDSLSSDGKATFILSKVSKTDFAYDLADLLEEQRNKKIAEAIAFHDKHEASPEERQLIAQHIKAKFAQELKGKLPNYIVKTIEYVTAPLDALEI